MSAFIIQPLQPEDEAAMRLGSGMHFAYYQPKLALARYFLVKAAGTCMEMSDDRCRLISYSVYDILYQIEYAEEWVVPARKVKFYTRAKVFDRITDDGTQGLIDIESLR